MTEREETHLSLFNNNNQFQTEEDKEETVNQVGATKQASQQAKDKDKALSDYKKLFHASREQKFHCCLTTCFLGTLWILFCVLLTLFVLYSLRPGFKIRLKSDGSLPSNIGNIHVIHDNMYGVIDADTFGLEEVSRSI